MKKCPQCNVEYSDETLEFCLEDGNRLETFRANRPTVQTQSPPFPTSEKTLFMPADKAEVETVRRSNFSNQVEAKPETSIESAVETYNVKPTEYTPVIVALAHNWWQWVYLENQYYNSFASYVLSANFLMWLLLLTAGILLSVYMLRNSKNKNLAYLSLIILAVNFLLFIVPRK